jgi:hypothetical protein
MKLYSCIAIFYNYVPPLRDLFLIYQGKDKIHGQQDILRVHSPVHMSGILFQRFSFKIEPDFSLSRIPYRSSPNSPHFRRV